MSDPLGAGDHGETPVPSRRSHVLSELRRHEAVIDTLVCDLMAENERLTRLLAAGRDMFVRGDYDTDKEQRTRLAGWMEATRGTQ